MIDRCVEDHEPLVEALPLLYRLVMSSAHPRQLGFTKTQMIILTSLQLYGTLRMSQIAEYISSSKEQATRAVAPLVDEGYVDRSTDPEKRTRIYVCLTEKGKALLRKWREDMLADLDTKLSESITSEERAEVRQAASSLVRILGKLH